MIESIDINAVLTCEVLGGKPCTRQAAWRVHQFCPVCGEDRHGGNSHWCNNHVAQMVMRGIKFRCTNGPEPVIIDYAEMIQRIELL